LRRVQAVQPIDQYIVDDGALYQGLRWNRGVAQIEQPIPQTLPPGGRINVGVDDDPYGGWV
jgi:hypothetical protein